MIICKLKGAVWATRKYEQLEGFKLMRVEELEPADAGAQPRSFVCIDTVGAGMGERVLVIEGSAAYHFMHENFNRNCPVDAVIVGILDEDVSL